MLWGKPARKGADMMKFLRLSVVAAALTGIAGAASAETLTFQLSNDYGAVDMEFYSQDRNHVWPGNGQVYPLLEGRQHITLSCQYDENICYGAWVSGDKDGIYWGVGPGQCGSCTNCCYHCTGGSPQVISIHE
jgi:hypothetical protein